MLVWSDEAQQAEAVQVLSAVLQFEKQQSGGGGDEDDDGGGDGNGTDAAGAGHDDDSVNGQPSDALARAYHTLAMLYYLLHDGDKVMNDVISHVVLYD